MQQRRLASAIVGGDLDQHVFGRCLRVLHEDVEVPIVVEDPGIEELVLVLLAGSLVVCFHQIVVRKGALRILVQVLHVRVRRRRIEIEVVLLDVLAVVPFAVGEAERALFQDGILAVPQSEREAEELLIV